jgi:hypothetical protein
LQNADPFAYAVYAFAFSQGVSDCACKLQMLVHAVSAFTFSQGVSDCTCKHQFHSVPQIMTLLQAKQFALLPAMAILCVLETAPWRIMESKNLEISVFDTDCFDKLMRQA